MKKFAQELGKYIDASGIKQTRIATTAGISYNYLQRLLSGSRHPSDQVVQKLAEALHLSSEQTGALFAAAGYAPPLHLLSTVHEQTQEKDIASTSHAGDDEYTKIAHQFYALAQAIPEEVQPSFFDEMRHLLGYARYKYILSGNADVLELHRSPQLKLMSGINSVAQEEAQLDMIAKIVGELSSDQEEEHELSNEETSQPSQAVDDMLLAIDRLLGNILTDRILPEGYQSQVVLQTFNVLRHGTPWEIRRRIVEALPSLLYLDLEEAVHLMEMLRLDFDEVRGADIRRRVMEALPDLFHVSPRYLPSIIHLLLPKSGDDIYVALATVEACEDIQDSIKHLLADESVQSSNVEVDKMQLQRGRTEIAQIERQLLLAWENVEKESLQFSMVLHNLLPAPDTLLISLREGLESEEKLMQLVAARYLERVLVLRPLEALELYKSLSHKTRRRNVRRTVAKALPQLLQSLKVASLPVRALTHDIISNLAVDPDIYIRRAVADHAPQIFDVDREFLLILLRLMHKDTDRVIRHRLQPVALHLAQIWLSWYAETAGLVDTKHRRTGKAISFGE